GLRQPAPRPDGHGRGAHRLLPPADGRLQVPPPGRVPRRAAQDGLRQAAPPRTPRPRLTAPRRAPQPPPQLQPHTPHYSLLSPHRTFQDHLNHGDVTSWWSGARRCDIVVVAV